MIVFDGWGLAAAFVRGVRCASATGAAARSAASRRTAAAAAFLLARLSQLRSSRCSRDRCAVLVARVPNLFQAPQDLAPSQTRRIRFAMVKHNEKVFICSFRATHSPTAPHDLRQTNQQTTTDTLIPIFEDFET